MTPPSRFPISGSRIDLTRIDPPSDPLPCGQQTCDQPTAEYGFVREDAGAEDMV